MHPVDFIEKNIREHLLRDGYSISVAQGGLMRQLIFTVGHPSQP